MNTKSQWSGLSNPNVRDIKSHKIGWGFKENLKRGGSKKSNTVQVLFTKDHAAAGTFEKRQSSPGNDCSEIRSTSIERIFRESL